MPARSRGKVCRARPAVRCEWPSRWHLPSGPPRTIRDRARAPGSAVTYLASFTSRHCIPSSAERREKVTDTLTQFRPQHRACGQRVPRRPRPHAESDRCAAKVEGTPVAPRCVLGGVAKQVSRRVHLPGQPPATMLWALTLGMRGELLLTPACPWQRTWHTRKVSPGAWAGRGGGHARMGVDGRERGRYSYG